MKKIGKYEIRATIGEGGMGTVYKAFDPFLKRDVAIKVISETLFAKGEVKERFLREAQSAAKLSHENITTVYDLGESRRKPYIVLCTVWRNHKQIISKRARKRNSDID